MTEAKSRPRKKAGEKSTKTNKVDSSEPEISKEQNVAAAGSSAPHAPVADREPQLPATRGKVGVFGGPIIRDWMHFFLAYEANDQDRASRVTLGNPAFASQFGQYEGAFTQPFREDLFFGKVDFQATDSQTLEFSVNYRDESEIKDFEGQTSYEAATDSRNTIRMARLAHWANVYDWQWNMLVPTLCDRVWAWCMEAALIAGQIGERPEAEWTPQPMPMIEPDTGDPVKRMTGVSLPPLMPTRVVRNPKP